MAKECLTKSYTLKYKININHITEPVTCKLLVNGAVTEEITVSAEQPEALFTYHGEPSSYTWIRADIRSSKGEFLGYINPVYVGEKERKYRTFGEIFTMLGDSKEN